MRTPARKKKRDELEEELDAVGLDLPEDEDEGDLDELGVAADDDEQDPEAEEEPLPMVAIVGRPNVGKSTLFNRIIGRRKAVVHDRPGVTRDRNIEKAVWSGTEFLCVDPGGYDVELDDPVLESVVEQVRIAIAEADVIIWLGAAGETTHPADHEIIRILRASKKPLFAAINKCDNPRAEAEANEFYSYGFANLYPISAEHGIGVGDLLSDVVEELREMENYIAHAQGSAGIALAIVGRQNVGKSTLINRLAGETRVIAADLPGTTRDAIDTIVTLPDGKRFTLIATAGIRRRGKVEVGIEKVAVLSAMMSLRRADVAALVIDAITGLTEQDAHIAGYCIDHGLALIILVNKWDAIEKDHKTADEFTKMLEQELKFIRFAPVLFISALGGQRTHRIFELVEKVYNNACSRVPTHELNERLTEWVGKRPPTMARNRRPKVRFLTQTGILPPTFTLFVNDTQLFHFSYRRYIVNRLREAYDFEGTPVRLILRQNKNKQNADEEEIELP